MHLVNRYHYPREEQPVDRIKLQKWSYADLKKVYDDAMIDLGEFLKYPDQSNFSLIEQPDVCRAFRVLQLIKSGSDGTKALSSGYCKGCPLSMTFQSEDRRICAIGRSAVIIRKALYEKHEGELFLEIVRFNEEFQVILEVYLERESVQK